MSDQPNPSASGECCHSWMYYRMEGKRVGFLKPLYINDDLRFVFGGGRVTEPMKCCPWCAAPKTHPAEQPQESPVVQSEKEPPEPFIPGGPDRGFEPFRMPAQPSDPPQVSDAALSVSNDLAHFLAHKELDWITIRDFIYGPIKKVTASLEKQLAEAKHAAIAFEDRVNATSKELAEAREEVAAVRSVSEDMRMACRGCSDENTSLKERVKELEKERSDLVSMMQDAERQAHIDVSDEECELWRIVESFFGRARDLWNEQLTVKDAEITELRRQLDASNKALAELMTEAQNGVQKSTTSALQAIAKANTERDAALSEVERLKAAYASTLGGAVLQDEERDSLRQQVADQFKQLTDKAGDIILLRQQLEESKSNEEAAQGKLTAAILGGKQEVDRLNEQLEESKRELEDLRELKRAIDVNGVVPATVMERLSDTETERDSLRQQFEEVKQHIEDTAKRLGLYSCADTEQDLWTVDLVNLLSKDIEETGAAINELREELESSQRREAAMRALLQDIPNCRDGLLRTYCGGYTHGTEEHEKCLKAFHHGIGTVFNWLEAKCKIDEDSGKDFVAISSLPADWSKDSSLETWFPITAKELEERRTECAELGKQLSETKRILESYRASVGLLKMASEKIDEAIKGDPSCQK